MKKILIATLFAATFTLPAFAQNVPAPDPSIQALSQMLQESMGREANALSRFYAADTKLRSTEADLAKVTAERDSLKSATK